MSKRQLLPSQPQLSFLLKQVSEDLQESDNESLCVSTYDENQEFDDGCSGLPLNVYKKWRKAALVVCGLSIGFEFFLGFASLVLSIIYQSPGTFGMAMDSFVDIATTLVVVWRFCGYQGEHYSYAREQRAVFSISILFILSSFGVFAKAIFDLARSNKPYHPYILCIIAAIAMVVYTALAWAKYSISQKLKSKVLFSDAVNTFCVDLMAAMLLLSLLIYKYTSTWFIGSIVAILISIFLFGYGLRNIVLQYQAKKKKEKSPLDESTHSE
ncbi:transmembrane protein 163a-like [Rhopilema esculentum]|uniref:transmembrane protein 163a-like n=1 Tax=Rhopilema esculentum TaxID=499914 RepID=UPI0031E465D6